MRDPSRLDDLLADRTLAALSLDDETELGGLLAASDDPQGDALRGDQLEEALALAAVVGCATGGASLGRGPSQKLLGRLQVDAAAWARQQRPSSLSPASRGPAAPASTRPVRSLAIVEAERAAAATTRKPSRLLVAGAVFGWAAAAALALVVVLQPGPEPPKVVTAYVPAPPPPALPQPSPLEERKALLARGASIVQMDWSSTKDAAAAGVSGDVVWSAADNKGFMRFRGLAVNDREQLQYQLWIFDKTRDQRHPIDGGVFDIDAATGDVIVPIQAKLPVREASLFAVTVEKPGGVVVSSRQRLVLLAKVPAG